MQSLISVPLDVREDSAAFLDPLGASLNEESISYETHALVLNIEWKRHHLLLQRCDLCKEPPDVGCPCVTAPYNVYELFELDLSRAIFVN